MNYFTFLKINQNSILVKKYEIMKGQYERDKDYLAAITENGIWIKEKNDELAFLVRVKKVNFEKSCKEYKDDDIDGQKIKISVE